MKGIGHSVILSDGYTTQCYAFIGSELHLLGFPSWSEGSSPNLLLRRLLQVDTHNHNSNHSGELHLLAESVSFYGCVSNKILAL